jgi:hypothetical protein
MDMTADQLREAYRVARTGAYNAAELSQHTPYRSRQGARVARSFGRSQAQVEMIERIADKRGISLTAPTSTK